MQLFAPRTAPKWQPLRRVLAILALFYLLFLLSRLALLALYPADFAPLSHSQILGALWRGARLFDTSITLTFLGLPILLLLLPFAWSRHRSWQNLWSWYACAVLAAFAFAQIADLLYFGLVHRHAGKELNATLQTDPVLFLSMAVQDYGLHLLLFAVAALPLLLFWRRYLTQRAERAEAVAAQSRWLLLALLLPLFVVGIRGSVVSKPIEPVYAFEGGSVEEGYLALNGVFTLLHARETIRPAAIDALPWEEATALVRQTLAAPNETWIDGDYPLARLQTGSGKPGRKPNIVVILLESWDADHVDFARRQMGDAPFDATPNFDALARAGRYYPNFYANGQRSIDAISAMVSELPPLPGLGYLGQGVETNRMGWLGQMAKAEGYRTIMMQASKRQSFYLDKIAPLAGFDTYLGGQDLQPSVHSDVATPAWGGWDHDLFLHAGDRFREAAAANEPFLGFLFTATTHPPYPIPGEKWRLTPGATPREQFLNSLFYADWALGQFVARARKEGWYENTIFVLTADHSSGMAGKSALRDQHHVPLLIVAPSLAAGIDTHLGSQLDLIPTLIDLAGWRSRHAGLGRSLLDHGGERAALLYRDDVVGMIDTQATLLLAQKEQIGGDGDAAAQAALKRRLLASVEVAMRLLMENRVMPPAAASNKERQP